MTDLLTLRRLLSEGPTRPLSVYQRAVDECSLGDGQYVVDAKGETTAFANAGPQVAALIVALVNSAPDLLAAVEAAVDVIREVPSADGALGGYRAVARLAAAVDRITATDAEGVEG